MAVDILSDSPELKFEDERLSHGTHHQLPVAEQPAPERAERYKDDLWEKFIRCK